ncbi:hypothetical protein SBA6_740035 [Candidatus Sulfopaludibacter sp. SbA6]|nr:hypothetical protein SBA6_740035 [Candidatus Sulfopaludibacter sp. SbA6]
MRLVHRSRQNPDQLPFPTQEAADVTWDPPRPAFTRFGRWRFLRYRLPNLRGGLDGRYDGRGEGREGGLAR